MVHWIITVGLTMAIAAALPPAIMAAKKSVRGKGRMAGAALAIGLAFSLLYDARSQAVIENIAGQRNEDEDEAGEPPGGL
jgi:hypothetical protein